MENRWGLAFSVAALLALVGGSVLRRLARRPEESSRILRRSGGVLLVLTLVGVALAPDHPRELLALAVAVVALAVGGLLADRGRLRGRAVPAMIVAVSIVPVASGVRAGVVGVGLTDTVFTVAAIAAVTMAVSGLGNTDGLLATVVTAAAAGFFALAAFGDQDALATVMVGLAGAGVGFYAYNARPASLFIGQAGSLPAGIALAVAAVEIRPAIDAPESFAVPLLVLALPVADAAVVALGRLRHRVPLLIRRPDHLPHRLRALGWNTRLVVGVLGGVQIVVSAVAVFVGRGVLALSVGAAIAIVPVVALMFVAAHGVVYHERADGPGAIAVLVVVGLGLAATAASLAAVLAGVQTREILNDGRRSAQAGISAARRGEPDIAAARFNEAAEKFAEARDKLGNPLVVAALGVPVLGSNVHAARELADAGLDLARAGEQLTGPVDPEKLRVRGGTIALDEVRRITPSLEEAAALLEETEERIDDIQTAFLVSPIRDAIDEVDQQLGRARRDAANGAGAARLAPAILGDDEPRRYFLAVQNPAELHATGGFIGSWGILTAQNGKVDLEFIDRVGVLNQRGGPDRTITGPDEYVERYSRFGPAQTWQNVNMSPDFAVVGQVIAELYPQSGGEQIDGVIGVDPVGLAALMQLTGPVQVEGWPEPLTAENVVDVTLNQAYRAFEQTPERAEFLGDVADVVFDVATEGDLGRPARVAGVLGEASRQGHFSVYFTRPEEQALAELVGADGSVPRTNSDSLMVVTQNAGANKIDYYLRRHVRYTMKIDPVGSGSSAAVTGRVEVDLENTAPDTGLPHSVIGPAEGHEDRFVAGQNFAYVSVYTPSELTRVTLGGIPTEVEVDPEFGRNVYSAFVSVGAHSTSTLSLELAGGVELDPGDWYTLELARQPFLAGDDVSIDLEVPDGWKIAETEGLQVDAEGHAVGRLELTEDATVRVRLEPAGGLNFWERLHHGG